MKRPRHRMLAGVSEAVATHLGWSVNIVRLIFVFSTLIMGAGALLYIWLWAFTPTADASQVKFEQPIIRRLPVAFLLTLLSVAMGIILMVTASHTLPIIWIVLWTASIGALVWTIRFDTHDPLRLPKQRKIVLLGGPIFLIFFGLVITLRNDQYLPLEVSLAFLTIVLGAVLLVTPIIRDWLDARLERQAEQARSNKHAEIAAHLHDSVLQTLALIQNRAGAASEVARIARAQERELRDWLYSGSAPIAQNMAAELRDIANGLELEHEVFFELVTVGFPEQDTVGVFDTHAELIAATREAMMNAARHAGGTVSVYVEQSEQQIEVFIRDRGPGFNPDDLPEDRFGVRNSIIGRMKRAGGTATVVSTPEQGSQVHLVLPRT